MRMRLARLDMIDVEPHALLRPATARHAGLVAVFKQDLVPDPGPLPRIQERPAGRVRKVTRIGPPEHDSADQVNHAVRIHISKSSVIHTSSTDYPIDALL